jgi:hypothetical protein
MNEFITKDNERGEIARKAARARWGKAKKDHER